MRCGVVWRVLCWGVVWYGVVSCRVMWCAVEAAMCILFFVLTKVDEIVKRCTHLQKKVSQIHRRCDHDMLKSKRVGTCFRKVKDLQSNLLTFEEIYIYIEPRHRGPLAI